MGNKILPSSDETRQQQSMHSVSKTSPAQSTSPGLDEKYLSNLSVSSQ